MKRMRNLKGFTLIELIVVILIIGILAGIAVIGYTNVTAKAQATAVKADASQLVTGLSAAATNDGSATVDGYLNDATDGGALSGPDGLASTTADNFASAQAYLTATFPMGSVTATYDSTNKVITVSNGNVANDVKISTAGAVAAIA